MSIPSPNGPLVDCISSKTIKNANQAVVEASSKPPKARGTYHHVDVEMQIKIVLYACKRGNKAACARACILRVSWVLMSSIAQYLSGK